MTSRSRLSATAIAAAVEPHFEILELTATQFRPDAERSIAAWLCRLRKRRTW